MARNTCPRRGLVEDYFLTLDELNLLMALRAGHIFMCALQREDRLLVIEEGGSPLRRVVAFRTPRHLVRARELGCVRIQVAVFALLRRSAEIYIFQAEFKVRRPMAFGTTHRAMCSGQRELRRSVVECSNIRPCVGVVACFTALPPRSHPLRKLSTMRICMTGRARQPLEVERGSHSRCRTLVAVAACHGRVSACEPELQLLVQRERKR